MYTTTKPGALSYLFYADLPAAIPWLCEVFGFAERFRLTLPNGVIAHAEIKLGDGVVMLGNVGPGNAAAPTSQRVGVYVFVEDVDVHYAHAKASGATILREPADQPFGDRMYLALDLEGHEWYFAQHLRNVAIADLQTMMDAR